MLITAFLGTLIWGKLREMLVNYVQNIGSKKAEPANSAHNISNDNHASGNGTDSEMEKRLEEKRRINLERKRAKYEKKVRKKYDRMMSVYEKWKNDRSVKSIELAKIIWSKEVHSNLSQRLEFAKEAHSYSFGMCDEIHSSIHDKAKEIDPEKRHAKLMIKLMILMENLHREKEITESEYGDLTRMVKIFFDAMYLSRIQRLAPVISEEILASWAEFKKIFDEFDNDVDNDGPNLEQIGRIVSHRLALMAIAVQVQQNAQPSLQTLPVDQNQPIPIVPVAAAVEAAAAAPSDVDASQQPNTQDPSHSTPDVNQPIMATTSNPILNETEAKNNTANG